MKLIKRPFLNMPAAIKWMRRLDDVSQTQRNIENNKRILCDFPWLWAVDNCWLFDQIAMRVWKHDLDFFFAQKIMDAELFNGERIYGVWIHGMGIFDGGPMETVETLWDGMAELASICDSPQQQWGGKLFNRISGPSAFHDGLKILHIAFRLWGGDALAVYRPASSKDFDDLICKFAISTLSTK